MKKLISCLASLLTASAAAVAMISSAAVTKPNKDPNGDGVLDMADATYIYQTLAGKYDPSDLTQLDIDDNGVVSDPDAIRVQYYDAGVEPQSETPDSLMQAASSSESSKRYAAYDAKTGTLLRTYALSVTNSSNTQGSTAETQAIIGGTDDRIEDYSNRGVAKIMCSESYYGYLGTGFVVGKHKIATAAHVVFDADNNYGYKIDNILLFDNNGQPTSFTPVEYHIPRNYVYEARRSDKEDYAIITVEEDLTEYMSFNLGMVTDYADDYRLTVATAGFPLELNNSTQINDKTNHDERLSLGSILNLKDGLIYVTYDSSSGNSGGPIYAVERINGKMYYTVVGIHTLGMIDGKNNAGVRINPYILKFFTDTANINY
ncbi:MAG: trypsin-like peptidase domain-containing protein [Alistipes sp.]|nr:trypsin-like peptidase domain-containing protein [Alistipes sp.]